MPSFEPANDLERAMLEASTDESRYEAFLRALAEGELFIPQEGGDEPGRREVGEDGEEISLPLVEHEGRTYVPVFTSLEQFRLGAPESMAFLRLRTDGLVEGWPQEHGMAINPGGTIGIALESDDVRGLAEPAETPATARLAAGTQVMLGEPAEEPDALLEAVAGACRAEGSVRSAYRALMAPEGSEEDPQIVIGLELDEGLDPEEVFNRIGAGAAPAATGAFSFVVVDETNLSGVARFLLLETDPFFRRD